MLASSVRFSLKICLLRMDVVADADQILGNLVRHGRRIRIGTVGLEIHAGRAQLLQFTVEYLEELTGDLDLIGQQGQPLVAQALDFLYRDVGVEQILIAARTPLRIEPLSFFFGQLLGCLLRLQAANFDAL